MRSKQKLAAIVAFAAGFIIFLAFYLHKSNIPVLEPRGTIGQQERHLIYTALLLSLIVVIPVFTMLIGFSLKYREGNKNARYDPSFDHSRLFESIWWGVPLTLILILASITWKSSHDLDPFKPLDPSQPAMAIQVIALDWKWLFIYPQQNIATVNYVQFPVNTPVRFEITSDAPMNSFWIPQLGGQIYAMSGMATHLNLQASQIGDYTGSSANISGNGFAGMHFTARASTEADFNNWVQGVKQAPGSLSLAAYNELARPSENNKIAYYSSAGSSLFDQVINKYMAPAYYNPAAEAR